MRVFIYAYEGMYGGLHGIFDRCVAEVQDVEEANNWGYDMAVDVFYGYGIDQEYETDEEGEFEIEPEYCWELYRIRDDVTLSIEDLNSLCHSLDKDCFVQEYCYPEPIE